MFTEAAAIAKLVELGWFLPRPTTKRALAEGLKRFQDWYGHEPTGELGAGTLRLLTERIDCGCGVKDIELARADASLCKWPMAEVAFYIARVPDMPGYTDEQVRQMVRDSWSAWNGVCGLRAYEVDRQSSCNVIVAVGRGRGHDFDGPSGVLAWSQLPCGATRTTQLLQRFDLDEEWSLAPARGKILAPNVWAHENGHAIGISHVPPKLGLALMNPMYRVDVTEPRDLDIAEAVTRDSASASPPAPPLPVPGSGRTITIQLTGDIRGPLEARVSGLRG